eukprot:1368165-Rhodomonas_salina.2
MRKSIRYPRSEAAAKAPPRWPDKEIGSETASATSWTIAMLYRIGREEPRFRSESRPKRMPLNPMELVVVLDCRSKNRPHQLSAPGCILALYELKLP